MSPNPQAPGYKEGIRLHKSTILHPTDFGQISLLSRIESCLATARQQLTCIVYFVLNLFLIIYIIFFLPFTVPGESDHLTT